ncbi:MAG: AzlC family ABC transporter permease [Eubacteriales bacterium]|nr:AzlC family ABC transporter permease [Eubacteriales bacterium]
MNSFKKGIKISLPICIGMISIGISFGLAARKAGLSIMEGTLMSMIVIAGSSQFFAIDMLSAGVSPVVIILGTFVINLRHFVMSTYIMKRLKNVPLFKKLILAYVVCDESFTMFSLSKKQEDDAAYLGGMNLMLYITWSLGSFLGCILMNFVPPKLSDALGIAIYAAFISMLMPSLMGSAKILMVVLFTAAVNTLLSTVMPNGTSIILAMLIGAFFGTMLPSDTKEQVK